MANTDRTQINARSNNLKTAKNTGAARVGASKSGAVRTGSQRAESTRTGNGRTGNKRPANARPQNRQNVQNRRTSTQSRHGSGSNGGKIAAVVGLLLLSIVGIFGIVLLTKDLLNGDGVKEQETTTVVFTAVVSSKDVKVPKGVIVNPEDFIESAAGSEGLTYEFEKPVVTEIKGDYDVNVVVTDANGATKTLTAKLNVYEDTQAPTITGVVDRHFNLGDKVTYLKGVEASDDMDEKVDIKVDNSKIELDEKSNPKVGEYEVIYTAIDRAGNKTEEKAKFIFEENGISDEMIDAVVKETLDSILKDDMTLEQKACAIYNYTYDNIAYTGDSNKDDYRREAYNGLTNHAGDCFTYFAVAKVLLNEIGVKTIDVERAPGMRNDHHYWLLVDLGTGYYHFDATRRKHLFNGFMATDAETEAYSNTYVYGFYYIDKEAYPATPTTSYQFTPYEGQVISGIPYDQAQ